METSIESLICMVGLVRTGSHVVACSLWGRLVDNCLRFSQTKLWGVTVTPRAQDTGPSKQ